MRSWALKRGFDVALSSVLLVVSSPLIAGIALKIKMADRDGPAIYAGKRLGRGGREFRMYKFRSMVTNADKVGGPNTSDADSRITPTGRFLRRYKLDELPQLLNVWKGDMSFVGPRPEVPSQAAKWTPEERQILRVRPGITDWSSLKFHNEGEILAAHPDPDRAYDEIIKPVKLQLSREYVERSTFADDLRILRDTAMLPFKRSRG
jgi:lipopolysaccharide/colanic/teichoic acid biosynthesis glycosyltransferase